MATVEVGAPTGAAGSAAVEVGAPTGTAAVPAIANAGLLFTPDGATWNPADIWIYVP